MGDGLITTAVGVTLGVMAALGLTATVQRLLFGVAPTDPVTFAAAIGVLTVASMLACYIPARRATKVAPIEALRET
jgi:ABC-type antimicrobial peptide transport system permease subunit